MLQKIRGMKITKKLVLVFSILIFVFAITSASLILLDNYSLANFRYFYDHPFQVTSKISDTRFLIQKINNDVTFAMIPEASFDLQAIQQDISLADSNISANIEILRSRYLGDPADIEAFVEDYQIWKYYRDKTIGLIQVKSNSAINQTLLSSLFQSNRMSDRLDKITNYAYGRANTFFSDANNSNTELIRVGIILAIVFCGISLIAAYVLSKNITKPIGEMIDVLNRADRGDEPGDMPSIARSDELGRVAIAIKDTLANMLNRQELNELRLIHERERLEERFRITLMSIGDGVIATDVEGNIEIINKAASELTGWEMHDAIGRALNEVFNIKNEDPELYHSNLVAEVLRAGYSIELESDTILVAKNGIIRSITDSASPIKDVSDNIVGMIVVFRDNTELKIAEDALKLSEKKYSSYIENAPDGVFVLNEKGQYIEANRAAAEMTGYSINELLHMTIGDLLAEQSQIAGMNHFKKLVDKGAARETLQHKHKDGTESWWIVDGVKLTENRFLGFAKDVTFQKNTEEKILYLSYHDELTGLYNRRFYEEELMRLDTKRNLPMSIVMGDLNGLKRINDAFGHEMGDELIRKSAQVIKKGCRADDIIARLGGDEFVIILPKTEAIKAEEINNRIKDLALNEKVGVMNISISLGYGTKNTKEEQIQDIFKKAEDHMYKQKRL
jgi:diguanylate cyclase (GGDEF)-like protein/PAS domain S-box-containing protein